MDGSALLVALLMMLGLSAAVIRVLMPSGRAIAQRRAELRRLAARLGLRYYGTTSTETVRFLPSFSLLQEGYDRHLANLIAEPRRPPRLLLFDHHAVHMQDSRDPRPSEYDNAALHLVAMAALTDGIDVTPVRVFRPDWIGGPVGVRDLYRLEFHGDPTFGSYYLFAGEPRTAARRMLTAPVREALANWTASGLRPVVEIVHGWVIVYVETAVADKDVAERAAALLSYATGLAKALGVGPFSANDTAAPEDIHNGQNTDNGHHRGERGDRRERAEEPAAAVSSASSASSAVDSFGRLGKGRRPAVGRRRDVLFGVLWFVSLIVIVILVWYAHF